MVLLTDNAFADCSKLKADCDAVINQAQKTIYDLNTQIGNYQKKDGLQQQIINDQDAKLNSPLHDPVKVAAGTTILILVLELVTGHIK